jgi:ABC-type tungstate transport system substrate-binding protein
MATDKRLAELARSLHRASERLWLRVTAPAKYQIAEADLAALEKANTDLNRAITKLKMKSKK